jgi:hypothetical protein
LITQQSDVIRAFELKDDPQEAMIPLAAQGSGMSRVSVSILVTNRFISILINFVFYINLLTGEKIWVLKWRSSPVATQIFSPVQKLM